MRFELLELDRNRNSASALSSSSTQRLLRTRVRCSQCISTIRPTKEELRTRELVPRAEFCLILLVPTIPSADGSPSQSVSVSMSPSPSTASQDVQPYESTLRIQPRAAIKAFCARPSSACLSCVGKCDSERCDRRSGGLSAQSDLSWSMSQTCRGRVV